MNKSVIYGLTENDLIVFDASALINVAATGYCLQIFEMLPGQCVAEEIVIGEISGDLDKYPVNKNIDDAVKCGVLSIVGMNSMEATTFLEFVYDENSNLLDQGEAATLAISSHRSGLAIVDEKKGTRIASQQVPPINVVSTLDLLNYIEKADGSNSVEIDKALYNSLIHARMRVPAAYENWVVSKLAKAQIEKCSSLRRSIREGL